MDDDKNDIEKNDESFDQTMIDETDDNDDMDYYEKALTGPTVDISDPLDRLKGKSGLDYYKECSYLVLRVGIVMYLGIRPDYPFHKGYMRQHGCYYCTWVLTIVAAEVILNYLITWEDHLGTDLLWPSIFFALSCLYYYGGLTLFMKVLNKPLSRKLGKAKVVMLFEVMVSTMWFILAVSIRAFCTSVDVVKFPDAIPEKVTTIGGLAILFTGWFFKGWACTLTGFNSYYWRDMVTETPNSRFVESSLYSYFSHPTYTIGYLPALSVPIYYRCVEGIGVYGVTQTLILLYVYFVEQPFVDRMYKKVEN
mmetsp:Transcript_10521/g.14758  ORF Transcript_10521/g.14758 Transcript_10521/m.14758 type:complete len:308 (-) Transcript_10521:226-1149(-)